MGKFKVGDRVRRVKHSGIICNCPIGHETEVEDLTSSGFWYTGADGKRQNTPTPDDWELVAPAGPTRTVTTTRTEIVEGVYGIVAVSEDGSMALWKHGIWAPHIRPTSAELTDAIATLTAIRDALAEAA